MHPDRGGDPDQFRVLQEAWERIQVEADQRRELTGAPSSAQAVPDEPSRAQSKLWRWPPIPLVGIAVYILLRVVLHLWFPRSTDDAPRPGDPIEAVTVAVSPRGSTLELNLDLDGVEEARTVDAPYTVVIPVDEDFSLEVRVRGVGGGRGTCVLSGETFESVSASGAQGARCAIRSVVREGEADTTIDAGPLLADPG